VFVNEVATDLDIRSLGALLRRYAVMIVVVTLLAAELGYWIASRDDPEYTASAEIEILDPSRDVVATTASSNFDLASQRETTKALVESPEVHAGVLSELGFEPTDTSISIRASGAGDGLIVRVKATAATAELAQRAADLAGAVATDVTKKRVADEFAAVAAQLESDSEQLDDRIRELDGRIAALDEASAQAGIAAVVPPGAVPTPSQIEAGLVTRQQADEASLAREQRATLFEHQLELERQAQQYQIKATVASAGFRPYRAATLPSHSSGPSALQTALLAGLAGLVLAFGLAYVLAYTDGRVRKATTLEAARVGMPFLAAVDAGRRRRSSAPLLRDYERDRAVTPARQAAALTLRLVASSHSPTVIAIAAPRKADQAHDVVFDVAVTLARAGHNVIVADADPWRADAENGGGLRAVLAGTSTIDDELRRVETGGTGSLAVLPAGGHSTDPVGSMSPAAIARLMGELRSRADCVLIDLPPAANSAVALAMSAQSDEVVLLARVGVTRRDDLVKVRDALSSVGAKVVGLLMVDPRSSGVPRERAARRDRTDPLVVLRTPAGGASPDAGEQDAARSG
jgi:Mrp family chromosome partitioning ATPase/capsular polysaccharide biosynthesis protein